MYVIKKAAPILFFADTPEPKRIRLALTVGCSAGGGIIYRDQIAQDMDYAEVPVVLDSGKVIEVSEIDMSSFVAGDIIIIDPETGKRFWNEDFQADLETVLMDVQGAEDLFEFYKLKKKYIKTFSRYASRAAKCLKEGDRENFLMECDWD